jgi:hypothetical protein
VLDTPVDYVLRVLSPSGKHTFWASEYLLFKSAVAFFRVAGNFFIPEIGHQAVQLIFFVGVLNEVVLAPRVHKDGSYEDVFVASLCGQFEVEQLGPLVLKDVLQGVSPVRVQFVVPGVSQVLELAPLLGTAVC